MVLGDHLHANGAHVCYPVSHGVPAADQGMDSSNQDARVLCYGESMATCERQ